MFDKRDKIRGENLPGNADDQIVLDRVQELTWALLDEQINEDECGLLENLLVSDDKARDCYIKCIQLHTSFMAQFAHASEESGSRTRSASTALRFLNPILPLGIELPPAEKATQ